MQKCLNGVVECWNNGENQSIPLLQIFMSRVTCVNNPNTNSIVPPSQSPTFPKSQSPTVSKSHIPKVSPSHQSFNPLNSLSHNIVKTEL